MKNFLIGTMCLFVMVGCTGTEEAAEGTPESAEAAAPSELGGMETASTVSCEKCSKEVSEDSAEVVSGQLVCSMCK